MTRHKIDGKGRVSKGLRLSCRPVRKVAQRAIIGGPAVTATREAFSRALHAENVNRDVGLIVVKTMAKHQHSGELPEFKGKGWNASLSMRTYQALRVVCGL